MAEALSEAAAGAGENGLGFRVGGRPTGLYTARYIGHIERLLSSRTLDRMAAIPECSVDSELGRFAVSCPCWPLGRNGGPCQARARRGHAWAVLGP